MNMFTKFILASFLVLSSTTHAANYYNYKIEKPIVSLSSIEENKIVNIPSDNRISKIIVDLLYSKSIQVYGVPRENSNSFYSYSIETGFTYGFIINEKMPEKLPRRYYNSSQKMKTKEIVIEFEKSKRIHNIEIDLSNESEILSGNIKPNIIYDNTFQDLKKPKNFYLFIKDVQHNRLVYIYKISFKHIS